MRLHYWADKDSIANTAPNFMFLLSKMVHSKPAPCSNTLSILVMFSSMGLFMQGLLTEGEKLSTVALLIKVACFVTKVNHFWNL